MIFYKRLRILREKHGLSRYQLCEQLNINYSTLAKYETNQRNPDFDMLIVLAKLFDVSVDYLIGARHDKFKELEIKLSIDEQVYLKKQLDFYRKLKSEFNFRSDE